MFKRKTKFNFKDSRDEFNKIEYYYNEHKRRFYCKLSSQIERPSRLLGQNGIALLQKFLTRSRYLLRGFIYSFNDSNSVICYLVVRSHFEITGATAHLLKWLNKFYSSACTYGELETEIKKLFLGNRAFMEDDSNYIKAINVLTLVNDVDTLFEKMGGGSEKNFQESYDFLSEFCHPNSLGVSVGSNVSMPSGIIDYVYPPKIYEHEATLLLSDLCISVSLFIDFYDKALKLLTENEELPTLEK